ncbi:MAG: L-ribulose-5-phosphate 4-epimerase AraD [Verrucomicrobiales bacterium]|nr:L-ribulose-5-phosphate 4-epimerase AraD [Verrucomicrobiales bacterium]
MTLSNLKDQVLSANLRIVSAGLAKLTWGNVSGCDPDSGCVVIKPSGVPYHQLRDDDLVVLNLEGRVLEGSLRPSSDTPTHLALYRAFPGIRGICHTHSPFATAFAQAAVELPCFGTTHADHFFGPVPVCRVLTPEEAGQDYEGITGAVIVECFRSRGIDPAAVPAVLQRYHAPFAWGLSPQEAVDNSIALEMCAQMALASLQLRPDLEPLPTHLLQKHYLRKHGPGAYYGQNH